MAYQIGWYVKNHIIFTKLWGVQTVEDGAAVNKKLSELLNTEDLVKVHILMDSTKLEKAPAVSMSLLNSTFRALRDSKISWFIAIGKVSIINSLMGIMLGQLFSLKYRNIATFEQTLHFLKDRDTTITWDIADPKILTNLEERTKTQ